MTKEKWLTAKLDPYTSVTIYPADTKKPIRVHGELETRGGRPIEIRLDAAEADRLVYALKNALRFHQPSGSRKSSG